MEEKRTFPRTECNEEIKYANGKSGHARDISLSGIRFSAHEKIGEGSFLTLFFSLQNNGLIKTTGQIVWCRDINNNTFENGLKFKSLSQESKSFISDYINQKLNMGAEKRNAQRYLIDVSINYSQNAKARTKNITENGMSIFTKNPLEEKQIFLLSIALPAGDSISMHGKIVWNKQLNSNLYENGIEFWNISNTEKMKLYRLSQSG